MYSYIKGIIKERDNSFIVIENNRIGYQITTPNPFSFQEGEEVIVFLYQYVREDEISLYGFKTIEEKELFLKLINVKGIGPKTTMPMLATGSVKGIINAIEEEDIFSLKKFPKIGDKVARQIILDLKGKLVKDDNLKEINSELIEILQSLGYKIKDINKVIKNIDNEDDIGNQVKEALKLMMK